MTFERDVLMNCPHCGQELEEGMVYTGASLINPMAVCYNEWVPKDQCGKVFRKNKVSLKADNPGWFPFGTEQRIASP